MDVQVERPWGSWPNVWTLGLAFGGFTLCMVEGSIPIFFIGYFQPTSLDSQQSLAIQSHGLSIWTVVL